jgi:hypothetical protein
MPYIVMDTITCEAIGPFDNEQEAIDFTVEASLILAEDSVYLDIHQLLEPQEWAFDNMDEEDATTIRVVKGIISGNSDNNKAQELSNAVSNS